MEKRAPGKSAYVSPRKEPDRAQIYSGTFEGKTTGAPISIIIENRDVDSSKYAPIKDLLRPGHANYTYLEKYGIFDDRGSGRASARETACRVAAGAVAQKLLNHFGVELFTFLQSAGGVEGEKEMMAAIEKAKEEGDSLGGVVAFIADHVPVGLGDPVYEKLHANLSKALMSLPAAKGFEIGEGFKAASMQGSLHNDLFTLQEGKVKTETNHAGGMLGGISSGMPICGRVAFKPAPSIMKPQKTINKNKEETTLTLPEGSRHDPCVAIRAVPVVEAMCALVIADALLMNRSAKL